MARSKRTGTPRARKRVAPKVSRATGGEREWTVMVFMAAAKDARTEQAAIRDMREMERVGSSDAVQVVAQIDRRWPGQAERFVIGQGRSTIVPDPPRDPLQARSLRKKFDSRQAQLDRFLDWARTNYRARRYMLVLWGHAYGLGFGREHGDDLRLRDLAASLNAFAAARDGNAPIDLLGANACAMSYAEAAYELRSAAQFMVASEITMPYAGWPYSQILNRLRRKPGQSPIQLGAGIIEDFMASYDNKGVSLTLLDLAKAEPLRESVSKLAKALRDGMQDSAQCELIGHAFLDTVHGDVRPLIDLADLCANLQSITQPKSDIHRSAAAIKSQLGILDKAGAGLIAGTAGRNATRRPLILTHRCDPDFDGLEGLGIFAHAVADPTDLARLELSEEEYFRLGLIKAPAERATESEVSPWGAFVYDDLRMHLEPLRESVEEFITATGASSREDRMAVGQLIIGVSRSFYRLDKAVDAGRAAITNVLNPADDDAQETARRARTFAAVSPVKETHLFLRLRDALDRDELEAVKAAAAMQGQLVAPVQPAGTPQGKQQISQRDPSPAVTIPLRELEDALRDTEQTMNRVLTNGTLGLGGGASAGGLGIDLGTQGGKPGLGIDLGTQGGKPGLGIDLGTPGGKPGLGIDLGTQGGKAGLGIDLGTQGGKAGLGTDLGTQPGKPGLGASTGATMSGFDDSARSVDLFRAVAVSLGQIELAMAKLQRAVIDETANAPLQGRELARTQERVDRAFETLKSLIATARTTALSVLVHPTEGLGPTRATGFGVAARKQLATFAGLSPQQLRLL